MYFKIYFFKVDVFFYFYLVFYATTKVFIIMIFFFSSSPARKNFAFIFQQKKNLKLQKN